VRRVSWSVIRRTPYRAHRTSKARLMLRGSIGWPVRVVNTSGCFSPQMHVFGQSAARAWSVLVALRDPQRRNADRRQRQRVGAAIGLKNLLMGERMPADAL
jgi:hypothetical protein